MRAPYNRKTTVIANVPPPSAVVILEMLNFILVERLLPVRYFLLDLIFQRTPCWNVTGVRCFLSVLDHKLEFMACLLYVA